MGLQIEGGGTGLKADVKSDAGGHAMCMALTQTPANMGGVRLFGENDPGVVTGSALLRSPEVSGDYRQRAGLDTLLLTETFNYAAQNTGVWSNILTTMAVTHGATGMVLNSGAITTLTTGAMVKSYRRFPLYGAGTLYCEWSVLHSVTPVSNQVFEIGLFDVAAATTVALLDGVMFRSNDGVMTGVISNNASETATAAFATHPTFGVMHKYNISVGERAVEFWIDDVLQAVLAVPATLGQPMASGSCAAATRVYNKASAPATGQSLRVSDCTVTLADYHTSKPWSAQMVGMGLSGIQGAGGMTQGQTANYVNSTVPASATLSNTAAGYTTLGGQFQFAAVAGAETDYALFAYQVPAATALVTGRTLHITGVSIDTINTVVAVATTPTVFQWAIGVGSTAVSLATAEGAATKAPRRMSLGMQSLPIAAAVGAIATTVIANFEPICVNAGEFVHIILRMPIGTATATEVFRGVVRIESYFE